MFKETFYRIQQKHVLTWQEIDGGVHFWVSFVEAHLPPQVACLVIVLVRLLLPLFLEQDPKKIKYTGIIRTNIRT